MIALSKYSQLKVRNGDLAWRQRNPIAPPAVFSEVVKVLGLTAPSIARSISVENVKSTSVDGHAMKCVKASRMSKGADRPGHS